MGKLNEFLSTRSYMEGYRPSQNDVCVYKACLGQSCNMDCSKFPHVSRWFTHINSFTPQQRSRFPGEVKEEKCDKSKSCETKCDKSKSCDKSGKRKRVRERERESKREKRRTCFNIWINRTTTTRRRKNKRHLLMLLEMRRVTMQHRLLLTPLLLLNMPKMQLQVRKPLSPDRLSFWMLNLKDRRLIWLN